jgi:hypothetical protein
VADPIRLPQVFQENVVGKPVSVSLQILKSNKVSGKQKLQELKNLTDRKCFMMFFVQLRIAVRRPPPPPERSYRPRQDPRMKAFCLLHAAHGRARNTRSQRAAMIAPGAAQGRPRC